MGRTPIFVRRRCRFRVLAAHHSHSIRFVFQRFIMINVSSEHKKISKKVDNTEKPFAWNETISTPSARVTARLSRLDTSQYR